MKTMTRTTVFVFLLLVMQSANAQDPSFAQFFSSPLNINPALTANINADWRVISNLRPMDRTCQPLYYRNSII